LALIGAFTEFVAMGVAVRRKAPVHDMHYIVQ
jgi:hypothetical protein